MGCGTVTLYADGVPLVSPNTVYGCPDDVVRFSVTHTLQLPVTYEWRVDGQIVNTTRDYYDLTYNSQIQFIQCQVSSRACGVVRVARAIGRDCQRCTTACNTQTAVFPSGLFTSLTDESGKIYRVRGGLKAVCIAGGNVVLANAIKQTIQANSVCDLKALKVMIYHNPNARDCLNMVIYNSPIVFELLKIDNRPYYINTSKC